MKRTSHLLLRPLFVALLLGLLLTLVLVFFRSGSEESGGDSIFQGAGQPPIEGASPHVGGDEVLSREGFSDTLERLETNGDFEDMLRRLQDQRQLFSEPAEFTSRFRRLFEAWFAKDMAGAIVGVGMVMEDDSGSFPLSGAELRAKALLDGGFKRMPEAPEVFMKAADELLPDRLRDNGYQTIVQQLAAADPDRCLEFVETSFGQGWLKERAVRDLFSTWSDKNLAEAVNAVAELAFPEDRRSAYEALVGSVTLSRPREGQIRMLEERGLPEDLVAKLRKTERERREIFGDPPPDQTRP